MEFELTSMKLDIRFVPEGTDFPYEPKQRCLDVPSDYKVNNFLNRALQHTRVALTWEEPNYDRLNFLDGKKIE